MKSLVRSFRYLPVLALAALVGSGPASADWLVMNDGSRLETDGAWSESGRMVTFTDLSGNFSAIRLTDVDLEASRAATAEAKAPKPAVAPPAPRESVFRLTDDDVEHVDPEDLDAPAGSGEADDEAENESIAAPSALNVVAWERDDTAAGDGTEIRATLENQGDDMAMGVEVDVTIYDDEGTRLATTRARVVATTVPPGQSTDLIATFPDIMDFTAVDFDVNHRPVRARSAGDAPSIDDQDFGNNDVGFDDGAPDDTGFDDMGFDDTGFDVEDPEAEESGEEA